MKLFLKKPAAAIIAFVLAAGLILPAAAYHLDDDATHPFANDAFYKNWERTDRPVLEGEADWTWIWGPKPFTDPMIEEYEDSPSGMRLVQYFDKSRKEINHPDADRDELWYVTNGLLVIEMVEEKIQISYEDWMPWPEPADQNIVGDPDDEDGITYADIKELDLRDKPALEEGTLIKQTIVNGEVVEDEDFAEYEVTAERRYTVDGIDHTVASVFWDFMNATGTVYENGEKVEDGKLFEHPVYGTGYPITEAHWGTFKVDNEQKDVLWQCFERRCLTYTPDNDEDWQVEAGNVGQHYYRWRYGDLGPDTETVQLFLVDTESEAAQVLEVFGCDDTLVPVDHDIVAHDAIEMRIAAALVMLFAYEHDGDLYNVFVETDSDLYIDTVTVADGTATVNFVGDLLSGGVCDDPRFEEQLRHTVLQFDEVDEVVLLYNGEPLDLSEE
jgi:hypothetical protein